MADQIHSTKFQDKTERNVFLMVFMLMIVVAIPGIVEIVPLFYLDETMEHNQHPEIVWQREAGTTLADWKPGDGVRPYTALELAGRDIYVREGCYTCHSQMIRPFRDEKERYGHYSLATESMYDHPFQWGSKRTGPDLARVGAKYSDDWQRRHLLAPRSVVPESVMPNYPWLAENMVDGGHITKAMSAMRTLGTPYTRDDIAAAAAEVQGRSELDAVVAYLQVLGTMVKFEDKDYRQ
ncbi:MAG: cytochrome-c oxidase, cbb3-type subunit II [Gammaproteobacteria bacterium]|nr:cytochrome-c oxidase, cbb3-type subunit II [Gammaproteobacteria bacterium]MCW8958273.1 cytochrome-c oxidase, cbb3-type subunit II [Gammaproteobacteria bacterium]MCW8972920.1 cytochrome-c oxidase, cbb3-type subunit II [Gammaproteobacteria bacterium]MCW8993847.1 cytochrome-c oxidase, cbb3-type subunit II [Gammaproteobacteria bacterium]